MSGPIARKFILAAAVLAHEINRAYCRGIGDYSHLPWDEAPEWQKTSAIAGVEAMAANPSHTPEQSHEGWLAFKEADGWTYGPVKDPDIKQHPCMVPYNQLPPEQRIKDALFTTAVRTALNVLPVEKGPTRLTPDHLKALVESETYLPDGTLTVCVLRLTNGSQVVGYSNVIAMTNFNAEMGRKVAFDNAFNKIWELEGYALKTRGV